MQRNCCPCLMHPYNTVFLRGAENLPSLKSSSILLLTPAVLTSVKPGIERVEVLCIQLILRDAQGFTKSLEMHHFPLPKELDGRRHVGTILHQPQDIVVGASCLLLRRHILEQVRDDIPLALELTGIERNTACRLGPDSQGVIHIIFIKTTLLDFIHGEVSGQLIHDCSHHLQMSQLLCSDIIQKPGHLLVGSSKLLGQIAHTCAHFSVRTQNPNQAIADYTVLKALLLPLSRILYLGQVKCWLRVLFHLYRKKTLLR